LGRMEWGWGKHHKNQQGRSNAGAGDAVDETILISLLFLCSFAVINSEDFDAFHKHP
jgi:hypothetical protein